ncbi:PI-PLC X domain-containing protein 2-like [Coccinella septempunctata]|uniref:PI-PLC X domain-containing protein 2-like n=1 Tax=Coccinella septempunctata TaxID=41139 RepID=UPI001D06922D|nr:PI-PLC X domain-containing protein 2-like [Coccinella septempunctata]
MRWNLWFWSRRYLFYLGYSLFLNHVVSETIKSTKCGSVFITVSSLKGSYIELNWQTSCGTDDVHPRTIALYNTDIRNRTEEVVLYDEIIAKNHPDGFYKTETPFNISEIPEDWKYNASTLSRLGVHALPYWIVSYSNTNEIIDIQPMKLQPSWMFDNREKLKNQHIGDLLIPGTHDSGCYGGIRIFEDYILTQDLPIWYQLIFGIRYLDLRIAYHQDQRFYINHEFVKVKKLDIIYSQIKEFVEKSPGEVLIIDFHRFPFPSVWDVELHHKFINYTLDQLGDYAYSKNGLQGHVSRGPTMGDIWKAGKNILFTYAEKRFTKVYPQLWDPIPQVWANTVSVHHLKNYLEDSLKRRSNNTIFNALMAELTPRTLDVITGKNTLRELANNVNSNVTKWVRDEWSKEVNIITSDFFLGNNLIDVAINVNRNR